MMLLVGCVGESKESSASELVPSHPAPNPVAGAEFLLTAEPDSNGRILANVGAVVTTAMLELVILDAGSGIAIPDARVRLPLRLPMPRYLVSIGVNRDGELRRAVPAGEAFAIRVRAHLHREKIVHIPALKPGSCHAETIALDSHPREKATVCVVDAIGRGVPRARIQLLGVNSKEPPVVSDRNGDATLTFIDTMKGHFLGRVEAGGFATRTFNARRRGEGEVHVFGACLADRPGAIPLDTALVAFGQVVDLSGRPVQDATIKVATDCFIPTDMVGGSHFPGAWEARTGALGNYEIIGIPCGVQLCWYVEGPNGDCAAENGLAVDPSTVERVWTVAPPIRVAGVVRDSDGLPLPDVHVVIGRIYAGDSELQIRGPHAQATTGPLGAFEMTRGYLGGTGIPWGRYAVRAIADWNGAVLIAREQIEASTGEVNVDIDLVATEVVETEPSWREKILRMATFMGNRGIYNRCQLGSVLAFGNEAVSFLEEALGDRERRRRAHQVLVRMDPELAVPILIREYSTLEVVDLSDEWFLRSIVGAIGTLGGADARSFLGAELACIDEPRSALAVVLRWAIEEAER